jgi:hypothetical protein
MLKKVLFALTLATICTNHATESQQESSRCELLIGETPGQDAQGIAVTTSKVQSLSDLKSSQLVVPQIAEGYEEVYFRFLKGKIVYKPNNDNDIGRKEFTIASLANPLEGMFDISKCDETAQYLQISTGFRTRVDPANKNKAEIWIVPQFLLQRDPRAKAYNDFLQMLPEQRNKPFAIMFTWGGWSDLSWHEVTGADGTEVDSLGEASDLEHTLGVGMVPRGLWRLMAGKFYTLIND